MTALRWILCLMGMCCTMSFVLPQAGALTLNYTDVTDTQIAILDSVSFVCRLDEKVNLPATSVIARLTLEANTDLRAGSPVINGSCSDGAEKVTFHVDGLGQIPGFDTDDLRVKELAIDMNNNGSYQPGELVAIGSDEFHYHGTATTVRCDLVYPVLTWTTPLASSWHGITDPLVITLNFSDEVLTIDTPLQLWVDGEGSEHCPMGTATLATNGKSAKWSNTLIEGELNTTDALSVYDAAGAVKDDVGNRVTIDVGGTSGNGYFNAAYTWHNVKIDTVYPVLSWDLVAETWHGIGDKLYVTLKFNEVVTIETGPSLSVDGEHDEGYSMGTGALAVDGRSFTWSPQLGPDVLNTETVLSVDTAAGAVEDRAENKVTIDMGGGVGNMYFNATHIWLPVLIDTKYPVVTWPETLSPAWHGIDDVFSISITFNEEVSVSEVLELHVNGDEAENYDMGTGTLAGDRLSFTWGPELGPEDLNTTSALSVEFVNGKIKDDADNEVSLTAGGPWTGVKIDTRYPTFTAAGTNAQEPYYGANREGSIRLTFDNSVWLESGQTVSLVMDEPGTSSGTSGPKTGVAYIDVDFLPDGSASDGSVGITALQYGNAGLAKIRDVAGNELQPGGPWPVGNFTIDNTYPASLAVNGDPNWPSGEPLSGTPANPIETLTATATETHPKSIVIVYKNVEYASPWEANVYEGMLSTSQTLTVVAVDRADNRTPKGFPFLVDNPRIGDYQLAVQDPIGGDSHDNVFPAGQPVTAKVKAQNLGAERVDNAKFKLTLERATGGLICSCETAGTTIPKEEWMTDWATCVLDVPTNADSGAATLKVTRLNPYLEDKLSEDASGYAVASSNVHLLVEFADPEVVAGSGLAFKGTLRQHDNGGVASYPDVKTSGFGSLGEQGWVDGSTGINYRDDLPSAQTRGPFEADSTKWVTGITTVDGTPLPFHRRSPASFEIMTTQSGDYVGDTGNGGRVYVRYKVDGSVEEDATVLIRNAVLENIIARDSEAYGEEFDVDDLSVFYGDDYDLFYGMRNAQPVVNARYRIEADLPNESEYFQEDENTDWVRTSGPTGTRKTWVYDPQDLYDPSIPSYPYRTSGSVPVWAPLKAHGRAAGSSVTDDTIIFRTWSNRREGVLQDIVSVEYLPECWSRRAMCPVDIGGSANAGATLRYALNLNVNGIGERLVNVLVDKVDGEVSLDLRVQSSDFKVLYGNPQNEKLFTAIEEVNGKEYYKAGPIPLPAGVDQTWTLQVKVREAIVDGTPVGLKREWVRLELPSELTCGYPEVSDQTPSCGATRVRGNNVKLVAVVTADPSGGDNGLLLPTGAQDTLYVAVQNVGQIDLSDENAYLQIGSVVIPGVTTVGSMPDFDPLLPAELGANGGRTAWQPWVLAAAANLQRQSNVPMENLFGTFEGWKFKYLPIRPSGSEGFDPASEFEDAGDVFNISAPNLKAVISLPTVPGTTIPEKNSFAVHVLVTNPDPGNQAGTFVIEWQGSMENIKYESPQGAVSRWPDPVPGQVNVNEEFWRDFTFTVTGDSGSLVPLLGKCIVRSDFGITSSDQTRDLTIVPTALEIISAQVLPETLPPATALTVTWEVRNNDDTRAILPSFKLAKASTDPDGYADDLELVEILYYPWEGDVGFFERKTSYEWGTEWNVGPGTQYAIDSMSTARVELRLQSGIGIPNGTVIRAGALTVMWDDKLGNLSPPSCAASNCVISADSVSVSDANPRADGTVTYTFHILNGNPDVSRPSDPNLLLRLDNPPGGLEWLDPSNPSTTNTFPPPPAASCAVTFKVPKDIRDGVKADHGTLNAWLDFAGAPSPPMTDTTYGADDYPDVECENVHFEIVSAVLNSDTEVGRAGETLDLNLDVKNTSLVDAADTLVGWVAYDHEGSSKSSRIDTLTVEVPGGIAAKATRPVQFELPLDPDFYGEGDRITFTSIGFDAGEHGSDPPVDRMDLVTSLVPVEAKNVDVRCRIWRLDGLLGAPAQQQTAGVDAQTDLAYGLSITNQGSVALTNQLEVRLVLGRDVGGPEWGKEFPAGTWSSVVGDFLTVTFKTDAGSWATQTDSLVFVPAGGPAHVPSALFGTGELGGKDFAILQAEAIGRFSAAGTLAVRTQVLQRLPGPVHVTQCSPSDLQLVLSVHGPTGSETPEFARGDSIPLRFEVAFGTIARSIPGRLSCLLRLEDDRFRIIDAARASRASWVEPADWSESEASLVSNGLFRMESPDSTTIWRICLQSDYPRSGAQQDLPLADILSINAQWKPKEQEVIPCGFADSLEFISYTRADSVTLADTRGQLVSFFARPNPAKDIMYICYDLTGRVTMLRLYVTDLAGNVVMTASDADGMGRRPGINCLEWHVAQDNVPNGVYLARLEVDGVNEADNTSLRSTRRAKVAVLK